MRTPALMVLHGVLAGVSCGPAAAHAPYFSQSEPIPATGYEAVTLRLLHGDGVFFSDPARAVVVSRDGRLLAASPISMSLRILCEGADLRRKCLAYDDLTRAVYEPEESRWRDAGPIERDGVPQRYPEGIAADFGFAGRAATVTEVVRFEIAGLSSSWMTTVIAVAWWTLFWVLLRPGIRCVFRRERLLTIGRVTVMLARTAGALLMIPVATYAWLLAPYSVVYLAFVFLCGATAAHLLPRWRKTPAI